MEIQLDIVVQSVCSLTNHLHVPEATTEGSNTDALLFPPSSEDSAGLSVTREGYTFIIQDHGCMTDRALILSTRYGVLNVSKLNFIISSKLCYNHILQLVQPMRINTEIQHSD